MRGAPSLLAIAIALAALQSTAALRAGRGEQAVKGGLPVLRRLGAGREPSAHAGGATYYLDADSGSDANAGTSPQAPWRTLARANGRRLGPGDRVLLAGGRTFRGTLELTREDSGAPGREIVVAAFGEGRARIDAGSGSGLILTGCSDVRVSGLDI